MEQEVKCEFCNGTGFVQYVEYNNDVHAFVPAGLIKCNHPDNNYEDYSSADGGD
jgi:hypothetical protein